MIVHSSMGLRIVALACFASALQGSADLNTVLERMDTAAAAWQGMRANVEWVRYMALVDDEHVESGRIVVRRSDAGDVEMLLSFQEPSAYFLSVRGARVERYKPKTRYWSKYDVGKSWGQARERLAARLRYGRKLPSRALRSRRGRRGDGRGSSDDQSWSCSLGIRTGEINNRSLEMWVSTATWPAGQAKDP